MSDLKELLRDIVVANHILAHEGVVAWDGAKILDWYRTQRQ